MEETYIDYKRNYLSPIFWSVHLRFKENWREQFPTEVEEVNFSWVILSKNLHVVC